MIFEKLQFINSRYHEGKRFDQKCSNSFASRWKTKNQKITLSIAAPETIKTLGTISALWI